MISSRYFENNSYARRGMILESDLNETNKYYLTNNIALIYKKPTPIKVVKVEFPKNVIKEAYFSEPSTLDYNGIYKEKYIEFDAKETTSKTSYPISNIHHHQLTHIKKVIEYGGIAFLIVRFTTINKTFFLNGNDLINYINENKRKSIPLSFFEEKGYLIEMKYTPRLDYIKIVDNIIKEKRKVIKYGKKETC